MYCFDHPLSTYTGRGHKFKHDTTCSIERILDGKRGAGDLQNRKGVSVLRKKGTKDDELGLLFIGGQNFEIGPHSYISPGSIEALGYATSFLRSFRTEQDVFIADRFLKP